LQKHSNSGKKSEPTTKRAKSRGPVQRDTKEVLAELVGKLKEKLDPKKTAGASARDGHPRGELRPNLDRLTVGVDLGDQGSHYCILGLEGETLAEGQLRTTEEDFATFFQGFMRRVWWLRSEHIRLGCRKSSAVAGTRCWWPTRG
jgi:hypothetical protein